MSEYDYRPIPPRPATQQEVTNQINQLRNQLEQQLRQAQLDSKKRASKRSLQIQQEQINKIQESLNALDATTRKNIDSIDKSHRKQMEDMTKRIYSDIEKAQKSTEKQVNSQIKDLAKDVSNKMKGLEKQIKSQQSDIKAIKDQMSAMEKNIDQRFKENEREIKDIHEDLESIHKQYKEEEALAQHTAKAARTLLEVVEKRTLLDRFAPNYEAQDVRNRIKELTETKLHGAALTAKAEEAIIQIKQTESHAIQEKAKHDALIEIALEQTEKVLTIVNENREFEQDVEGGEPMKIENEFWSEGEYGRLENELNNLKTELEDRYNNKLTKERIEEIARRSVEIEGRILQINAESVARAVLSEARVETAEDIVNAMKSKGWVPKVTAGKPEFDYMGGEVDHDWRKGVCAVLENNLGEVMTVIVDPVSDYDNVLIVHQETSLSGKTDKKVREGMQVINQELHDKGYETGTSLSGVANIPEMGSVERLGRAHATDKVRQKIKV